MMGHMKDLLITIYGGGDEAIEAAQQIAGLSEIVPHDDEPGWIPVEDRLPERNEIVLAFDQGGVTVGSYSPMLEDWWTLQVGRMSPGAVVTHWMPLPEPPEVK
jgi:hypothetical protein